MKTTDRAFGIRWWSVARVLLATVMLATVAFAANPIQIENAKTGTTAWQLTNPATNHEIEGYASAVSVNRGGQISFFVNTTDTSYTLQIFRLGWYSGSGGRSLTQPVTLPGIQQAIPTPDPNTGLIECHWTNPYTITVPNSADPTDWASGVYVAKLTGTSSQLQSNIIFVVRDDARPSNILFQSSVNTFQAYNNWGGKSLYTFNSDGGTAAVKVSFNRPYGLGPNALSYSGVGAGEFLTTFAPDSETYAAGWEYPFTRFLEREGYDVSYTTDVDVHSNGAALLLHRAFLSVGHNEYWSWQQRANVTTARDQGVSLGFFSANDIYWQVRYEASPADGTPNRTLVSYKEQALTKDPVYLAGDPSQYYLVTTQWRLSPVNLPEDALIGVMYITNPVNSDWVVDNGSSWVFANTGLRTGDHLTGLLGYEVDAMAGGAPTGTVRIGHSLYDATSNAYSDATVYTAASGATVFATGSIQWAWGLDDFGTPTIRPSVLNASAQQITRNVLNRFSLFSLTLNPYSILGGGTVQGVVYLGAPAPSGGTLVNLSSSSPSAATPASVLVPAGATSASFTITTTGVSSPTQAGISATYNGFTKTATLTVQPPISVQVTPISSSLFASQSQQFKASVIGVASDGTSNPNVTWSLSPQVGTLTASGLYTAPASIATNQTVTVTATSVGDPSKSASAALSLLTPGSFVPIRQYAGSVSYTDPYGLVWSPDSNFSGGSTYSTTSPIEGTNMPKIYQQIRYGANFSYQFTVPNGTYTVNLKFAELYYNSPGQRIFNVAINGTPVLSNFDIVAQAGATLTAYDTHFSVNVTAGKITIQFTAGSVDVPSINAIEIVQPPQGVAVQLSPTSVSLSALQSQQFSASVSGTPNTSVVWSLSPANGTISSSGLYTAPSFIATNQVVNVKATSIIDPSKSSTAQVTLLGPSGVFPGVHVYAGSKPYTDSSGQLWSADTGFTGGNTYSAASNTIQNTTAPTLYQTVRYGNFSYQFAAPNGTCIVTLKFAEIYYTTVGKRIFNVNINGATALANFDIVAQAGAAFTAIDKAFAVPVSNGTITIQFIAGSADVPSINAISIVQPPPGITVQVSPTSSTLSALQSQQFTAAVSGTSNATVSWSMSPAVGALTSAGLYTAPSYIAANQTVTVTANSVVDPSKSSSATVNLLASGTYPGIHQYAGSTPYTDPSGQTWAADNGFSGGNTYSTSSTIKNTTVPVLYQTVLYGSNFSYQFIVPNGTRTVTLKFAEVYYTSPGQRVFNVAINNMTVLSNFDIVAQAGGALTAVDKTFTVPVSNGQLTIQFTAGSADVPVINAIAIQ